jgi:hypothetical protein
VGYCSHYEDVTAQANQTCGTYNNTSFSGDFAEVFEGFLEIQNNCTYTAPSGILFNAGHPINVAGDSERVEIKHDNAMNASKSVGPCLVLIFLYLLLLGFDMTIRSSIRMPICQLGKGSPIWLSALSVSVKASTPDLIRVSCLGRGRLSHSHRYYLSSSSPGRGIWCHLVDSKRCPPTLLTCLWIIFSPGKLVETFPGY